MGLNLKRFKLSPFLTAAGLARSRPALCHVTCFVICYTNRRTFAQVLQPWILKEKDHAPKLLHHSTVILKTLTLITLINTDFR